MAFGFNTPAASAVLLSFPFSDQFIVVALLASKKRIWQTKPVTYKPCVKPPFLAVFRSSLTATAVDGDIFRNLRRGERAPLLTMDAQNRGEIKQCKEIKCTFRQALMDVEHCLISIYYCILLLIIDLIISTDSGIMYFQGTTLPLQLISALDWRPVHIPASCTMTAVIGSSTHPHIPEQD